MRPEERSQVPIVVHTIVRNVEKFMLLLERQNTGFMDGFLVPPGGHVERGESISLAAQREVEEECNITLKELHPVLVMPFEGGIDFIFESSRWMGEPNIGEPSKFSSVGWFDPCSLPDNVAPFVRKAVELIECGTWYHEYRE
ncbi:MAG: NUDIX domain-containing protein [Gammaproteobacteria bacterium]|nr:NUDIX domain-containing protein [Gammaproteobacteria bacterium]